MPHLKIRPNSAFLFICKITPATLSGHRSLTFRRKSCLGVQAICKWFDIWKFQFTIFGYLWYFGIYVPECELATQILGQYLVACVCDQQVMEVINRADPIFDTYMRPHNLSIESAWVRGCVRNIWQQELSHSSSRPSVNKNPSHLLC